MSQQFIHPYLKDSIDRSFSDGTFRLVDARLHYESFEVTMEINPFDFKDSNIAEKFDLSYPDFYLEPQEEGGFVAYSKEYSGAIGQGETWNEAVKDLEEAIQILKEVLEEDKVSKKGK